MLRRLVLCWALLALALPALGQRSLVIESFDVTIRVEPDGGIVVTETIQPHFTGKWNGIYRAIPIKYRTPQGFSKELYLELLAITGEDGQSLRYDTSDERHYRKFKIWVPGAQDATRTVNIVYRVPNALLYFEDHDELYWNITGDEWEIPIRRASAVVELPSGVTGVRTLVFTGSYGSRESDADAEVQGSTVRFRMRRELSFREGMTAVVGWDKGFVREPTAAESASLFLRSNWPLFLPVPVFVFMGWLWWTRGRDPRLRPISVAYAPPENLSPAELGTLIDNSPDMRDITATLVDLAVRGHLLIEEKKQEHLLGLWSSKDYVFHRRTPPANALPLKPHERALLDALFAEGGTSVSLESLENKFYKHLPKIKDHIFDSLLAKRYYDHRPDRVRAFYIVLAIVVFFLSVAVGEFLETWSNVARQTWVVAGLVSGAIVLGFGLFMPARTLAGARALEGILGFSEFLSRVETDRFERMVLTPEMFEKYLPYAMALGVEKRWVAAFDDICRQPPEWYRGGDLGTFRPSSFVGNMNRMASTAASAMASAPRSHGGSGFGGGSSGGGGGGGGGGGF